MDFLPDAFKALDQYKQFIVYKMTLRNDGSGKMDKFPVHPQTGQKIGIDVPELWMHSTEALMAARAINADGIGFVFTKDDPFFFFDLDNCVDETTGQWNQITMAMLAYFEGAAFEISQSGKGWHIIGIASILNHRKKSPINNNLELYTEKRFVALVGGYTTGKADFNCQSQINWLVENYFAPTVINSGSTEWTYHPHAEWLGPQNDDDLIQIMLKANSARRAFNKAANFRELWEGDLTVLQSIYGDDESKYDAALAQHLAYWTGNNCERIRTLMLKCNLRREKWNRGNPYTNTPSGSDYLPYTIINACKKQTQFFQQKHIENSEEIKILQEQGFEIPQLMPNNDPTFLDFNQQVEKFKGCVYVIDEDKILKPGGFLLTERQFKSVYSGYTFPLDTRNEKITRNAWEAFTQSQALSKKEKCLADSTCFRPNLQPGALVEEEGIRLVNLWFPPNIARSAGNVEPFINHVVKLFPDENDFIIIISYFAAMVQYPGIKFSFAPFIQGMPGNGKSLLLMFLSYIIGRRYSHFPNIQNMDEKYNDWLYRKLFIGINDAQTTYFSDEFIETLKTWITECQLEIRSMGMNKVMRDICCNFIITSNYKDGIRKDETERRFAPFFCPQQNKGDLQRSGLVGTYFSDLTKWFFSHDGYKIVAEYLYTFDIPNQFNPANREPAPITSCTGQSINYSLGTVEQEILECIQDGRSGFRGGWISSIQLDALLQHLRAERRIPRNRRRELLMRLDYVVHPNLHDGRTNSRVAPDGGKPRLFLKKDHEALKLNDPVQIERAYQDAQSD